MSAAFAARAAAPFPIELQIWLSPAFPVGSFAYSHGLEWAAGAGRVEDRASAKAWLGDLIAHGGVRSDAILLAQAWRAVACASTSACMASPLDETEGSAGLPATAGLAGLNALALAMAGSRERHLETTMQGNAFITAVLASWGNDLMVEVREALKGDVAYPIAVGSATAARGIALSAVLTAFLTGTIQSLVSALVRLSVIGQTDGQHVIAALVPAIAATAAMAGQSTLDDLGGAAFVSDIAAMAHETQDTRLFRS